MSDAATAERSRDTSEAAAKRAGTLEVRVKRQAGPRTPSRWERFRVPYTPGMNVIAVLMEIRCNPVTVDGEETTPVTWEMSCLEEICGACTMLINGRVRQACSAIVDRLHKPLRLEPMSKFPLVRDLVVDRGVMFEQLKQIRAWIPIDGTYPLGPGPRLDESRRQVAYELSKCFTCGCCLEACPQYNPLTGFIGATNLSWTAYYGMHPTGARNQDERLDAVMGPGGAQTCGNAQNCVQVCPKGIPLTDAIYRVKRATTGRAYRRWSDD